MAKACIFCGRRGPFSAEHVLPEWTARLIGVEEGVRLQVHGKRYDEPEKTWQAVGSFGQTVRSVCEDCNGGWMSDLENLARPFLSEMILPSSPAPVRLSPDQQIVLASWLWKTAIVHEHASTVKYFNGAERRALRRGDSPPNNNVLMWISTYVGPLIANLKGGPAEFVTPDGRQLDGYLISLTIGLFAAQVLCTRKLGQTRTRPRARYNLAAAEAMIWPESPDIVWWPMTDRLDGDDFNRWHMRWNTGP
jgi:hypothetical protein